jgi:hypothetical protein
MNYRIKFTLATAFVLLVVILITFGIPGLGHALMVHVNMKVLLFIYASVVGAVYIFLRGDKE